MTRALGGPGGRGRAATRRPECHAGLPERAALPPGTLVQRAAGPAQRAGHRLAPAPWRGRRGRAAARRSRPRCPACRRWVAAWMQLVEFCAGYYQRSLGEVALSVLPPELRKLDDAQMSRAPGAAAAPAPRPARRPADACRCRSLTDEQAARWSSWPRADDAAAPHLAARRHRQRQDRGLPAQPRPVRSTRGGRCWCWCRRST